MRENAARDHRWACLWFIVWPALIYLTLSFIFQKLHLVSTSHFTSLHLKAIRLIIDRYSAIVPQSINISAITFYCDCFLFFKVKEQMEFVRPQT